MATLGACLAAVREATLADVKRAYKRLARKYHPDINPGDRLAAAQFRQIAEAYETLSDTQRRQQYDTTGALRVNVTWLVTPTGPPFARWNAAYCSL